MSVLKVRTYVRPCVTVFQATSTCRTDISALNGRRLSSFPSPTLFSGFLRIKPYSVVDTKRHQRVYDIFHSYELSISVDIPRAVRFIDGSLFSLRGSLRSATVARGRSRDYRFEAPSFPTVLLCFPHIETRADDSLSRRSVCDRVRPARDGNESGEGPARSLYRFTRSAKHPCEADHLVALLRCSI